MWRCRRTKESKEKNSMCNAHASWPSHHKGHFNFIDFIWLIIEVYKSNSCSNIEHMVDQDILAKAASG